MRAPKVCHAGFTLIEVMVALVIMAVMAGLAWRGLDGILRSREISQQAVDSTMRLATVLTQWEQDLTSLHEDPSTPALSFDGKTLRLTRRNAGGVQLVAWSLNGNRWQRWVSPTVTSVEALQQAWLRSQQLQGAEPEQLLLLENVGRWQIFFYRGASWSNAQSSGDIVQAAPAEGSASAPAVNREALPSGVRLEIEIDGRMLTRDIALSPQSS